MGVQAQPIQTPPQPQRPVTGNGEEFLEEVETEVGFWQEPWVQNGLPIVASLLIHVGLILLGLLTYTAYKAATTVTQEQVIVPDAAIVAGDTGGIPNPGLDGDPNRPAASDLVPENTKTDGWNKQPSKSLQAAIAGGAGDTAADTIIGVGADQTMGNGKGSTVGSGGEGASAPFGVPGGGKGTGPRSPFMGVSGNAMTVAYVCDASGSMMGEPLDLVKIELQKAIEVLSPVQAFNIIFFHEGEADALSKRSLFMANPNNKHAAYDFLKTVHEGASSDPTKALRLAFSEHPTLIYLLTDGAFDDNDAVVNEIGKLNVGKKTRVNTIAFIDPKLESSDRKACEDVLRKIALQNGGEFKVVLTDDLIKQ